MSKILKRLKAAFCSHKFEPDALADIKRQFYANKHYNNTLFDNSTYRTYASGWYYCDICCQPNKSIWLDCELILGGANPKTKEVIDSWLDSHRACVVDYIDPQTYCRITKKRGVVTKRPIETISSIFVG